MSHGHQLHQVRSSAGKPGCSMKQRPALVCSQRAGSPPQFHRGQPKLINIIGEVAKSPSMHIVRSGSQYPKAGKRPPFHKVHVHHHKRTITSLRNAAGRMLLMFCYTNSSLQSLTGRDTNLWQENVWNHYASMAYARHSNTY